MENFHVSVQNFHRFFKHYRIIGFIYSEDDTKKKKTQFVEWHILSKLILHEYVWKLLVHNILVMFG